MTLDAVISPRNSGAFGPGLVRADSVMLALLGFAVEHSSNGVHFCKDDHFELCPPMKIVFTLGLTRNGDPIIDYATEATRLSSSLVQLHNTKVPRTPPRASEALLLSAGRLGRTVARM